MKTPTPNIIYSMDPHAFQHLVMRHGDKEWVLDTETSGLMVRGLDAPHRAEWVGLTPMGTHSCLVWTRDEFDNGIRQIVEAMAPYQIVMQNGRFDVHALDLKVERWVDMAGHFYYGSTTAFWGLDARARVLGWRKVKTPPLMKSEYPWEANRIHEVSREDQGTYLGDDCLLTAHLGRTDMRFDYVTEHDAALEWAVQRMETRGIRVLEEPLKAFESQCHRVKAESLAKMRNMGLKGEPTPINIGNWLVSRGHDLPRTDKTKRIQTNARALEPLFNEGHEDALTLKEYRSSTKLLDSFVAGLGNFTQPDGMLYPSVNTCRVKTSRYSYSDPALQQAPKRHPVLGAMARMIVTSRDNYVSVADFSQIDLRCAAANSGEPVLLEAFRAGRDPYVEVAASAWGVSLDAVTKDQRFLAKTIQQGTLNWMGPTLLSNKLRCSVLEAKRYLDDYWRGVPQLKEWMEGVREEARRTRIVKTVAGRTLILGPNDNPNVATSIKNQGGAGEVVRRAQVALEEAGLEPILQMHDEFVCQKGTGAEVAECMTAAANAAFPGVFGDVDFAADGSEGATWYEAG